MDNPMINVDADAIEGTVTDMYKMMVKLIRVFADIEAVQVRTHVMNYFILITICFCRT